jgi:hypothetical protein
MNYKKVIIMVTKRMNLSYVLLLLLIVGCGSNSGGDSGGDSGGNSSNNINPYSENGQRWSNKNLPITYRVPRAYFEKYITQFNNVEASYQAAAGKDLVNFVPVDDDPKFSTTGEAHNAGDYTQDNMFIFFKDGDNFNDMDGEILGKTRWNDNDGDIFYANIFVKENGNANEFGEVLLHEVGHSLGFQHIEDESSFMNTVTNDPYQGFINTDSDRVQEKYLLYAFIETYKDLEGMGAKDEGADIERLQEMVSFNYGLSEERSYEVSRIINSYEKVKNKRSLTERDRNTFSKSLFGIDYASGKKAIKSHIEGDEDALNDVLERAADLNGISPEDVQEMVGEYLLN